MKVVSIWSWSSSTAFQKSTSHFTLVHSDTTEVLWNTISTIDIRLVEVGWCHLQVSVSVLHWQLNLFKSVSVQTSGLESQHQCLILMNGPSDWVHTSREGASNSEQCSCSPESIHNERTCRKEQQISPLVKSEGRDREQWDGQMHTRQVSTESPTRPGCKEELKSVICCETENFPLGYF